jgi:hypothetical protein
MTAIAIWYNKEIQSNPCLWIAADSLVSTAHSKLIDDGAKVFGLPVICKSPGPDGFFSNVYYAHTFGYCFAGSTLMGQNAYLALAQLLSDLISPTQYVPSLHDVAQNVLAFLRQSFDVYKVRAAQNAMFEVAIFGYCNHTQQLSVYHFAPKLENGVWQIMLIQHPLTKENDFVYLGDDKVNMSAAITSAFSNEAVPGMPLSRIPRYVIQKQIDDESCTTIGGDIQLGIADRFGYHPYKLCKPRVKGQGEAFISYLGRELTPEMSRVGNAIVGGPAMI